MMLKIPVNAHAHGCHKEKKLYFVPNAEQQYQQNTFLARDNFFPQAKFESSIDYLLQKLNPKKL